MTQLALSPYELKVRGGENLREGYLLRVEFADIGYGYADLFPWPEFGDPTFEQIPQLLVDGDTCPLFEQSLYFAEQDAKARAQKKPLLAGIRLKNHYLISNLQKVTVQDIEKALSKGFTSFKIKLNRSEDLPQFKKIAGSLPPSADLRLDFNTRGVETFFTALGNLKANIQFIEDPYTQPNQWDSQSWPLAFDQPGFGYEEVNTEWQIIKPARQSQEDIFAKKIVFTSSMDHPVGIAHALLQAAQHGTQVFDYGLMSQFVYKDTVFHPFILAEGPWLSIAPGNGIGFDTILARQPWRVLEC